jgi:hypothetical protein
MADNDNGGAGAGAPAAAAPAAVGHRIDEWREPVEKKLLEMFNNEAPVLECIKKLLRDTGSLIAGGGILNAIQPFPALHDKMMSSRDIDIYVPTSQIPTFIDRVRADDCLKSDRVKEIEASLYCKSFLRKNGIRKIYTLSTKYKFSYNNILIDVMSVRNKRTPLAVVNNFDLTFCQVWYDGEAVYASHPDHIREKKGFMSAEYIPTFLAGNRFLARRTNKYIKRGFTILPDPASAGLAEIFQKLPDQLKLMKGHKSNEQTNEQLRKWMNHTLLKIAKQNVDIMDSIYRFDPPNYYPVIPGNVSRRAVPDFIFTKNLHDGLEYRDSFYSKTYAKSSSILGSAPFAHVINKIRTDGYDSDDLINERANFNNDENNDENNDDKIRENYIKNDLIKADIIGKYYTDSPDDLVFTIEENVRLPIPSDDLKYHRAMTRILIHSLGVDYTEVEDDHQLYNFNGTFRHIINKLKEIDMPDEVDVGRLAKNKKYAEAMKLFMTRYGEDMMGVNGPVFDIHNHPMEGAITQEGLEAYCETHIADVDKTEVPCYWQPELGNSPKNCKHKLKLEEVRAIVSDEFYERYAKPALIKTGLNQIVPAYNIVFSDKKSRNAVWGDVFGKSVCPFCLQVENRESGCAYMEHLNPTRQPTSNAPYCQEHFKTPIWETYRQQAVQLLGAEGIPEHLVQLEFCIECGRPCANHRHFDLNNPPGLLPAADPGRCTGGGRPELYARILAIREIYGTLDINVPAEERAAAAAAAEGAARDPAYIARGRAIFEKAEAERKWNVNVPAHKNYNNDAYRGVGVVNEADEKELNDNHMPALAPNLNGGGRRRRTYKKRKGSKFTRKMN